MAYCLRGHSDIQSHEDAGQKRSARTLKDAEVCFKAIGALSADLPTVPLSTAAGLRHALDQKGCHYVFFLFTSSVGFSNDLNVHSCSLTVISRALMFSYNFIC